MLRLSSQIRFSRKAKKLTQNGLAKILGCRQQSISDWEKGRRKPRTAMLGRLAKYLGFSLDKVIL